MNTRSTVKALNRALEILGSESAVATALGYTQQAVNEVFRAGRPAPPKWCIKLEKATGGKVTRHQLRPDLYPPDEVAA